MPTPDAIEGLGIGRAGAPTGAAGPNLHSGESERGPSAGTEPATPTPLPSTGKNAPGLPQQPFVLSEGLAPLPPKLMAKIQKLEFVDMAELLRDNLEVQRCVSSQEQSSAQAAQSRSRRREVPDLLSWVSCFRTYMAVLTDKYSEKIKQLLAYQTLIVREARRCGGDGWLAYDSYFRQQVVGDPTADWSGLNTSLYAVTFMAQGGKGGQSCTTCMETDHGREDCAMLQHRSLSPHPAKRAISSPAADAYPSNRGKRRLASITCFAWNQGECRYLHCKYRHVCVRCSGEHPMSRCPSLWRDRDGRLGRDHGMSRDGPKGPPRA